MRGEGATLAAGRRRRAGRASRTTDRRRPRIAAFARRRSVCQSCRLSAADSTAPLGPAGSGAGPVPSPPPEGRSSDGVVTSPGPPPGEGCRSRSSSGGGKPNATGRVECPQTAPVPRAALCTARRTQSRASSQGCRGARRPGAFPSVGAFWSPDCSPTVANSGRSFDPFAPPICDLKWAIGNFTRAASVVGTPDDSRRACR